MYIGLFYLTPCMVLIHLASYNSRFGGPKQITSDLHSGSLGHSFNKIFEPQATSERLPCKSNDIEPLKPKYLLGELQSKTLLPNS